MMLYSVTKIFGVDAVKTRIFKTKKAAQEDIDETIKLLVDDPIKAVEKIEKENEEVYYIINKSSNPEEYIELILRRNEVR